MKEQGPNAKCFNCNKMFFSVFADTSFDSDIDESLVCSKLCGIEAGLSEDKLEELTE